LPDRLKILSFILLLSLFQSGRLLCQTSVSGTDFNNVKTSVTGIGANFVNVSDITGFGAGDTVLVIQMKGARILTPEDNTYGQYQTRTGFPGQHEFLIIQSVNPGQLIFTANMLNSYTVEGVTQVIKVRYFQSARVTGKLESAEWDPVTGTGGVLAMIVGGNLTLEADIDMSGKGFTGGAVSEGTGECAGLDEALRNRFSYDATSTYSGFKGEGVAITNNLLVPLFPGFAKGKGASFSGGGGGNGKFSGGGGGGGFGAGGNGEEEFAGCIIVDAYGRGGRGYTGTPIENGIFSGGGGGASTYLAGGTASPGGRGGGIIIIVADTIHGNGHSIIASGAQPVAVATGNAGAGGGGGGGTISLSVKGYGSTTLNITSAGGKGGNTTNTRGSGGGGGGGRIWSSIPFTGYPVTRIVIGGNPGDINYPTGSPSGSAGSIGRVDTNYAVKLNGFLFNSVRSSVTYSSTDSICETLIPPKLAGTQPIGGTLPYTFLWQKSYDGTVWNDLANTEGPGINFTPSVAETDTLYFRRVITDNSSPTQIVDISNTIKIIVQPLIADNIVGKDTTICFNQNPLELKHYNSGPAGGNGTYAYLWQQSPDNTIFSPAINANNGSSYDPPALTATTYYQRVITSGRCKDTSNLVTITVLPLVAGNSIAADQVICEGDLFADLTGSTPTGGAGAGTYTYQWISRSSSTSWMPASGTNNAINHNPEEADFPATLFFSRVVYSGPDDVCRDTSAFRTLTMHPQISGNTISGNQTICQGSQPAIISGPVPSGGDGSYLYTWQDSSKLQSWTSIPGFINSTEAGYLPPPLSDSTGYRRITFSSACSDTSNVIRVYVHKTVTNFTIALISGGADTTVCLGATPNLLRGEPAAGGTEIPGDYAYEWFYSTDNITWIPVPAAGTGADYQPAALTVTTWFRRTVVSGECSAVSNPVTVNVLPLISNNVMPADHMVCFNTVPPLLNATTPAGGNGSYLYQWELSTDGGGSWNNAPGASTPEDYQPAALTAPVLFRRVVTSGPSGCCNDISLPVSIGIHALPTGNITALPDTICRKDVTTTMNIDLTGAAPWSVTLNAGAGTVALPPVAASPYTATLTPSATTIYTLATITDNNGCVATVKTGSFELTFYEDPVARTNPQTSDEVCGLVYDLVPVPSFGTGTWMYPGVPVTTTADLGSGRLRVTVDSYSTWGFWWKEQNWKCVDSVRLDVRFWEMPNPVAAGPDATTVLNFVKLAAAPPSLFTAGNWSYPGNPADMVFDDPADPGTWVSGLRLGQNVFTWTVENGRCVATDDVQITYNPVPEGFSPDGNGINDLFEIAGMEGTENELVIINISGLELVRFRNYSSITGYWDGKDRNGKDLPDGTYYYFLTVTKPYASRIGGYVIIKRKLNE